MRKFDGFPPRGGRRYDFRLRIALAVVIFSAAVVAKSGSAADALAEAPGEGVPAAVTLSAGPWLEKEPVRIPAAGALKALPSADPASIEGVQAWVALLADDFESGISGQKWFVQGTGPSWGTWDCWHVSGLNSAGCAAGGDGAITCGQSYPSALTSDLVAGPFDLSATTNVAGVLECALKLNSEEGADKFGMYVSDGGSSFYGVQYSGSLQQTVSIDLSDVYTIGSVLDATRLYVLFRFQSDASTVFAEGAQIDDVQLSVDTVEVNQEPTVTLTAPNGAEELAMGQTQAITYTAEDPDSWPQDLTVSFDYSLDGGSIWIPIAEGESPTGSFDWTVPYEASTTVRVRVRATDGAAEVSDASDGNLAILPNQPPTVTLIAPNGGETVPVLSTYRVLYTAADADEGPEPLLIDIYRSVDDGQSWVLVSADQPNTGVYTWSVPDLTTDRMLLRVVADDGADPVGDDSDAVFFVTATTNALGLETASGASGATVTVPLVLDNEDAVQGIQTDILFDGAYAYFSGVALATRSTGMAVDGEQIAAGRARVILYYEGDSQLGIGSDPVAEISFTLQGPGGGSTPLTLESTVLSGPKGQSYAAQTSAGSLTVSEPEGTPVLQITALKNPGRPRTLQILVHVRAGSASGSNLQVSVDGTYPDLTDLGQGVYLGVYSAAENATSVTIEASDRNINGLGTAQAIVDLP